MGAHLRNLACPVLAESAFPNITRIFEILVLYAWPPKTRPLRCQNSVLPSIAPLREVFWILLWSNSTIICFLSDGPARVQAPRESGLFRCSFPDGVWNSLCPIFWHLNLYWREGWIFWCGVFRKTMILLETSCIPWNTMNIYRNSLDNCQPAWSRNVENYKEVTGLLRRA